MRDKQQAIQILEENAAECNMNVKEYAEHSAQEDPTFFTWLFPESEHIENYGLGMSKEEEKEANEFIASL